MIFHAVGLKVIAASERRRDALEGSTMDDMASHSEDQRRTRADDREEEEAES